MSDENVNDGRMEQLKEIIMSDWRAECARIEDDIKPSGGLDGPLTSALAEANRRAKQRLIDLSTNGIEPVPDKETGLGAWAR